MHLFASVWQWKNEVRQKTSSGITIDWYHDEAAMDNKKKTRSKSHGKHLFGRPIEIRTEEASNVFFWVLLFSFSPHHFVMIFFLDLQSKEAEQMLVLFPIKSRVDLKLCADERKREKNRLLKPIFFIRHTNKFALSLDIIDSRQPKTAAAAAALRQTRRIDFLHITPNRASLSISHCVN